MKFKKYDGSAEHAIKELENSPLKKNNPNFPVCANKCHAIVCHKYTQENLKKQMKNIEIQLEIAKINNRELKAKLAEYERKN